MNKHISTLRAFVFGTKFQRLLGIKYAFVVLLLLTPVYQSFGAAVKWNTFAGNAQHDLIEDTATDSAGTVYTLYRRAGDIRLVRTNNMGIHQGDTAIFTGDAAGTNGSIAVDAAGNIYVAGMSNGPWGAPINSHSGAGKRDVYVAKLSNTGQRIWNTFVGDAFSDDQASGVAVDTAGNVIITGFSFRSWGSPLANHSNGLSGALPGNRDAFIAKFDSGGALTWNTFLGSAQDDSGDAITVDSSNNIYAAGQSVGNWGGPVTPHTGGNGNNDPFAVKLNSAGVVQWNTFAGSSNNDEESSAIDVDNSGNIYVSGGSAGTWGTPVNSASGGYEGWVASFSNNGSLQWNSFLGGISSDWAYDVVADSAGAVYVAGRAFGTWGNPIASPASGGGQEAYVARLIGSDAVSGIPGTLDWNISLGSAGFDEGFSINLDGNGDLTLGIIGSNDWGSPVIPFHGGFDVSIAKLCISCNQVTATVDSGGTMPFSYVAAPAGGTASIIVLSNSGYITDTAVGGTCAAGTWNGTTYTTGVVNAPCTLSFAHTNYTVTASLGANGTVMPNSVITTSGNTASFTVSPATGYVATGTPVFGNCPGGSWVGNIYTTGATTGPCNVVFQTQLIKHDVTASVDENGSLGDTAASVVPGNTVTFDVFPNTGYVTDTVAGGTCPTGSFDLAKQQYTTGPINEDCSVSFTHSIMTFDITLTAGANGTVSPAEVPQIDFGQTFEFTTIPDVGYSAGVMGSCGGVLIGNVFTTNAITADCSVDVSFTVNSYLVETNNPNPELGTISPDTQMIDHGEVASFIVTPEPESNVLSVSGCGGNWTGTSPYITDPIIAACTIEVIFGESGDCDFITIPAANNTVVIICL